MPSLLCRAADWPMIMSSGEVKRTILPERVGKEGGGRDGGKTGEKKEGREGERQVGRQ